jgi:DsbC/DsbD-like thiol-disulfide interchange protein
VRQLIIICLCLLVVACAKPAANNPDVSRVTSVGVVKATPQETTIARGASGDAIIRLRIENGYHVNANPPSYPYLIPTQIELSPAESIAVDFITYPDALTKKFSFAEQPLAVYEGETDVKVRLSAGKSAQTGMHNLSGKLSVQACDDQVCYAPGTIDITLPVNVK